MTLQDMGMIWGGVNKGETEHKLAIYKLLKDAYASLDKDQLDFLIDRVFEKDAVSLSKDDVELLGDLTRYNYKHREEFC